MDSLPKYSNAAWFAIRLMLAVVFVFHGSQKLFGAFGGPGMDGFVAYNESLGIPFPVLGSYLAAATEFFGGIVLLLGTGARFAAIPMVFTMLVASFVAHSGFDIQQGGMEYSLTLAVVLSAVVLNGPGEWTVTRIVKRSNAAAREQIATNAPA
jgi:putative oxidoreductase